MKVSLIGYPAMWNRQRWMLGKLSEHVDLRIEVPAVWNGKRPDENLSGLHYETHRTVFRNKIRFHVQPFIAGSINDWGADAVVSWVEPHHLGSLSINRVEAPLVYFTWENLVDVPTNPLLKYVEGKAFDRADAVICGTADAQDRVNAKGFDGRTTIIPQTGLNTDFLKPMDVDRATYDIDEDDDVVLYVGRLAEEKGVRYLVEALDGLDATLLVVGDGEQRDALESQAADVDADIRFLGFKEYDALPGLYNVADVFVFPSAGTDTWEEQFGYAMFEALSCGTSVIATDCGSIPKVVPDCVDIVPRKDADALREQLEARLNNRESLQQRGVEGRAWVGDHLTTEVVANKYYSFLRDIQR